LGLEDWNAKWAAEVAGVGETGVVAWREVTLIGIWG
jgi:hypothetical protein